MADTKPFEQVFPMVSYRWRYNDGQYSPYAEFTEPIFRQEPIDEVESYEQGYNVSMFNAITSFSINDIPRGGPDVVAIDIVYKESESAAEYLAHTIEIPEAQRGMGTESVTISRRSFDAVLPPDQLLRHFDNVPRLAKAQEITANRLVYANYLQNFEQDAAADITISTALITNPLNGLSVKGDRVYQVGIVYLDEFGRQGGMLTSPSSTITTDLTNQNRIRLTGQIMTDAPSYAESFRYFIKDVSNDYNNIIAYNVYPDGIPTETLSENVWVEFLSSDRNKIEEGTILIPRRVNNSVNQSKQTHAVKEISNEVPNTVVNFITRGPDVEYITLGSPSEDGFNWSNPADYDPSGSGTAADLPTAASPSGRFINLREASGSDGLAQYAWFAAINGFLAQNRLPQIQELDPEVATFNADAGAGDEMPASTQSVSIPFDADQQLYIEFGTVSTGTFTGSGVFTQVKSIKFAPVNPNETRDVLTLETYENVPTGLNSTSDFRFSTARITEEAQERLQGRFWSLISRRSLMNGNSTFNSDGSVNQLHQVWFETEPVSSPIELELFRETSTTFPISEHGLVNNISWSNCSASVSTGGTSNGVYLESHKIGDRFNGISMGKGVRVNSPQPRYAEDRRKAGLIWSGVYNSRTGINRLNQFITANGITKEVEPNYGSIQLLHTRDTNLIVACENKFFRILADKDLLFNADGGGNVSASNQVLGQTTPFVGEYGISTNPESFASYGHNFYCSDANRGVVLKVTPGNGQIFEISDIGMSDFFKDRLSLSERIIGAYDDYRDSYMISLQNYGTTNARITSNPISGETGSSTLLFDTKLGQSGGWSSRVSYLPQSALSLNDVFYSFNDIDIYSHNSATKNFFYDTQYDSRVEVIFNDQPSLVKNFLTLGYEGSEGWTGLLLEGLMADGTTVSFGISDFVNKEGKWYSPIKQEVVKYIMGTGTGQILTSQGFTLIPDGMRTESGIKCIGLRVLLANTGTGMEELFAINTSQYTSS